MVARNITDRIDIGFAQFAVNIAHICTLHSSTSDKFLSSYRIYAKQDGGQVDDPAYGGPEAFPLVPLLVIS
jgi:hypothetical protein